MPITSMAAIVIGFLATGQLPYNGEDHLIRCLPEDSLVRQAHVSEKHAAGWFGFDTSIRRCCDELNYSFEWEESKKTSRYYQVHNVINSVIMSSESREALDLYIASNRVKSLVATILPHTCEDKIYQECSYIMEALEKISPSTYMTNSNNSFVSGDTNVSLGQNSLSIQDL